MIALKQPTLNEQLDFDKLMLFRNGVTQIFYNSGSRFCHFTCRSLPSMSTINFVYMYNFSPLCKYPKRDPETYSIRKMFVKCSQQLSKILLIELKIAGQGKSLHLSKKIFHRYFSKRLSKLNEFIFYLILMVLRYSFMGSGFI